MIPLGHVNKCFREHHVLKDITLSIEQGEKIVIIGPSGSNKSTLTRCMNQLEEVNDGFAIINNIDTAKPKIPIQKTRRKVTVVLQNFNLYAHKTIIDNLTLVPIKVIGASKDEAIHIDMEYLERVGLANKAFTYPSQLPGGQQQWVATVRALNMHPETILFDEPTSALNPGMIQEILDAVVDLSKRGTTMVCATHEMGPARQVVGRVVLMDQGQVIERGIPEHFFTSAENPRAKEFLSKTIRNG